MELGSIERERGKEFKKNRVTVFPSFLFQEMKNKVDKELRLAMRVVSVFASMTEKP